MTYYLRIILLLHWEKKIFSGLHNNIKAFPRQNFGKIEKEGKNALTFKVSSVHFLPVRRYWWCLVSYGDGLHPSIFLAFFSLGMFFPAHAICVGFCANYVQYEHWTVSSGAFCPKYFELIIFTFASYPRNQWYLAEWLYSVDYQCRGRTVLSSIPASYETVESEMKQCAWNIGLKNPEKLLQNRPPGGI